MKTKGIYKITNIKNGKVYIGQSMNIPERFIKHIKDLNENTHHSYKLQSDWNKYNEDSFKFEIIEQLPDDVDSYKSMYYLLYKEDLFIKEYNSLNEGYNCEDTLSKIFNGEITKICGGNINIELLKTIINNPKSFSIYNSNENIYNNTFLDNNFICIPNIFVQNKMENNKTIDSYINKYGKRIICYMNKLLELKTRKNEVYFTIDGIIDISHIDLVIRRAREELRNVLSMMKDEGLILSDIDFLDTTKLKSTDFIKLKLNISNNNEFFMLYDDDYNKIMNCNTILNKYNLLNLFCNISSRIQSNNLLNNMKVAYPSYEKISEDIYISSHKSLKQYIDKLVELDLIRFDNAGDKVMYQGNKCSRLMSCNTYILYSTPNWKSLLDNSINKYRKEMKNGWTFVSDDKKSNANERRSITQKINVLSKLKENGTINKRQEKELNKLISKNKGE